MNEKDWAAVRALAHNARVLAEQVLEAEDPPLHASVVLRQAEEMLSRLDEIANKGLVQKEKQ